MPDTPGTNERQDADAARDLMRQMVDLIKAEIQQLPSDRSRQMFFSHLHKAAACKMNPPPACEFAANQPEERQQDRIPRRTRENNPVSTLPQDVEEALSISRSIVENARYIESDEGIEFAESVSEKSRSIGRTIERNNRVTVNQMRALQNMLEGTLQWLQDEEA